LRSTAILFCALLFTLPAGAATCGGDFSAFLGAMSRDAAAAGISRTVIDSAFAGLTPDGTVLAFDRRQRGTFRKSFEDYAATRVVPARLHRARQFMQRHAALLARIAGRTTRFNVRNVAFREPIASRSTDFLTEPDLERFIAQQIPFGNFRLAQMPRLSCILLPIR
jgi:hypothetical protein